MNPLVKLVFEKNYGCTDEQVQEYSQTLRRISGEPYTLGDLAVLTVDLLERRCTGIDISMIPPVCLVAKLALIWMFLCVELSTQFCQSW